jgi:methanol--5-hydroxybenzimidazolylcobamide Co-methyltransferase
MIPDKISQKEGLGMMNIAYQEAKDLRFGRARRPVRLPGGLAIGAGDVIPEANFTMPAIALNQGTVEGAFQQYESIIDGICGRAAELEQRDLVAELELLPPMTYNPAWGIEACKRVREALHRWEARAGLRTALRITPVDIREDPAAPHMWKGEHWDKVLRTFEGCARAGSDLLSIESIGGKDVHDTALVECDLRKSLFALGVLAIRDMDRLWPAIVEIAGAEGRLPAGDTACAFANTAMVLADRKYIPRVFAAVVRVISAARSLRAIERGAVGPHKDCGYEGVYVKAITGVPIAMEGRSSACAHLSHVGNVAAAMADLWSNESVQNVKLLGGMAPTISLEQLVYDCRLMNAASRRGDAEALLLRDLFVESDAALDPQAYVLAPDVVLAIARRMAARDTPFARALEAARAAVAALRDGAASGRLRIEEREAVWLDTMDEQLATIGDEGAFTDAMIGECRGDKFDPRKYDL